MSFRILLYAAVIAPFVVLSAVNVISLQHLIRQSEEGIEADRQAWVQAASRRIAARMERIDKVAIGLSKPTEIVGAVEATDNDVLFDWGNSFIGEIDSVFFTDATGLVLARAPDEFRFGDELGEVPFVRQALRDGLYQGISTVDGFDSLVSCRAIRKYDDALVGSVCAATFLTARMLAAVVPSETMRLTLVRPAERPAEETVTPQRRPLGMTIDGFDFALAFSDGHHHADLLSLKRSLLINGALAVVVTLAVLLFFVRRHFTPYATLVRAIVDYAGNRLDIGALRRRLTALRRGPTQEITQISEALTDMIDVHVRNLRRAEEFNSYLRDLANKDPLTGLRNRRALDEALAIESQRSRRYGTPLCALIVDIDHFKPINDTHGHPAGDEVLRHLSTIFRENSRSTDIVGRWGGEEFLILCPGISLSEGRTFAEKLRQTVERASFANDLSLTVSIGLAEFAANEPARTMIERADRALYRAKASGRNRVDLQVE